MKIFFFNIVFQQKLNKIENDKCNKQVTAASSFSNRPVSSNQQPQNNELLILENDHVNFDAIKSAHPQLQEHDLKAIHRLDLFLI